MTGAKKTKLPSDTMLQAGCSALLSQGVRVLHRRANSFESTFPSEIVRVETADGAERELFIKHEAGNGRDQGWAHRRGIRYEARVYHEFLRDTTAPHCHGLHVDPETNLGFLALDHVPDAFLACQHPNANAIVGVAKWLGGFHAEMASTRSEWPDFLTRCEQKLRVTWSEAAMERATQVGEHASWLPELARTHEELVAATKPEQPTLLHGEFFPSNVLLTGTGVVHPIDWESAALGAGELDLAMLVDGWDHQIREQARRAYVSARWPGEPAEDLRAPLEAAQLSLAFRLVSETPGVMADKVRDRLESLRSMALSLRVGGW